jgi:DNA primase
MNSYEELLKRKIESLKTTKKNKKYIKPTPEQIEYWLSKNFEIKFGKDNGQLRICNPDGDVHFKLYINIEKAAVHDFRPNHQQYDGSFLNFVAKYKNIEFNDAVKEVCGTNIIYIDKNDKIEMDQKNNDEIELPIGSKLLKGGSGKCWEVCMEYLTKTRALTEEMIYKYKLHYRGTYIVVPYYEYEMLVYYQCRGFLNKKFEFPDEKVYHKNAGDFLWGFDNIEPNTYVIVVESIFNAISIGESAVATGGASLKDGQISLLKALNPHTIILAPDNDGAGIESLKDYWTLYKLKKDNLFKNIEFCLPPKHKKIEKYDWNEMLKEGLSSYDYIMKNKKPLTAQLLFNGIR